MKKEDVIKHWIKSADNDFPVMETLFEKGHYNWSLFLGHLILEKILKACYAKHIEKDPPRIHNLLKIAEDARLELSEEQKMFLDEVTTYNIRVRYQDYKNRFAKLATKEYTEESIKKIKEFRQWLLQQINR
jgi:HEPN domain-containing protein